MAYNTNNQNYEVILNLHICTECGSQFSTNEDLEKHFLSSHEDYKGLQFSCNKCSDQFISMDILRDHILSEHEGVRYRCLRCDKKYFEIDKLKLHVKSVHEGAGYACKKCGKKFSSKGILKTHFQSLHKDGTNISRKRNLKTHIETMHEGCNGTISLLTIREGALYVCKQCGKTFSTKGNILCNTCPYQSSTKQDLKKHIQSSHK